MTHTSNKKEISNKKNTFAPQIIQSKSKPTRTQKTQHSNRTISTMNLDIFPNRISISERRMGHCWVFRL